MDEVRVETWSELNEQLFHGAWQKALGRFRSHYAFRGQSDGAGELTSSLRRLGGAYEKQEGHLLRNLRKYALRQSTAWLDSVWTWLAMGQHYGLPTRLLDWTYSPFVALHFATDDLERFDRDGVIWCVDYVKTNEVLPDALKSALKNEGSDVFTVEMLDGVSRTLAEFDRLAKAPFVVFLEPPSLDDRIVNQFALFSLMSSPTARLDQWLAQHPESFRRIVLPAKLKWEVRDKLDQANINERVLFPGFDGLSRWLKRYYSPRPQE